MADYLHDVMEGTLDQKKVNPGSCDAAFSADPKSSYTGTASISRPPIPEKWVQVAGLRFYSPEMGRWLSRDPLGETGGENLFAAVDNDTLSHCDPLGMEIGVNCCQSVVNNAIEENWKARALIAAIQSDPECEFKPPECRNDCHSAGGYNSGTKQIRVCANRLDSNYEAETTLVHELVHAYDDCKGRLTDNCEHVVCSEIRAWDISGDCARGGSQYNEYEDYRDCIRRNASRNALTATNNGVPVCSEATVHSMMDRMMRQCLGNSPTPYE